MISSQNSGIPNPGRASPTLTFHSHPSPSRGPWEFPHGKCSSGWGFWDEIPAYQPLSSMPGSAIPNKAIIRKKIQNPTFHVSLDPPRATSKLQVSMDIPVWDNSSSQIRVCHRLPKKHPKIPPALSQILGSSGRE